MSGPFFRERAPFSPSRQQTLPPSRRSPPSSLSGSQCPVSRVFSYSPSLPFIQSKLVESIFFNLPPGRDEVEIQVELGTIDALSDQDEHRYKPEIPRHTKEKQRKNDSHSDPDTRDQEPQGVSPPGSQESPDVDHADPQEESDDQNRNLSKHRKQQDASKHYASTFLDGRGSPLYRDIDHVNGSERREPQKQTEDSNRRCRRNEKEESG